MISIDTAEGKQAGVKGREDSDYNIGNIFEVELMSPARVRRNKRSTMKKQVTYADCIRYRQVGIYIDNERDEEELAEAMKAVVFNVLKCGTGNVDNVRMLIEMNFNGKNFVNKFKACDSFYDGVIIKTYHNKPVPGQQHTRQFGYKTVGGERGKGYWCEMGAKMIADGRLIISQFDNDWNKSSIGELENFGKNEKGVYEGCCVHDDIAMTVLSVSHTLDDSLEDYAAWLEEFVDNLPKDDKHVEEVKKLMRVYSEGESDWSDQDFNAIYGFDNIYSPYHQMMPSIGRSMKF